MIRPLAAMLLPFRAWWERTDWAPAPGVRTRCTPPLEANPDRRFDQGLNWTGMRAGVVVLIPNR